MWMWRFRMRSTVWLRDTPSTSLWWRRSRGWKRRTAGWRPTTDLGSRAGGTPWPWERTSRRLCTSPPLLSPISVPWTCGASVASCACACAGEAVFGSLEKRQFIKTTLRESDWRKLINFNKPAAFPSPVWTFLTVYIFSQASSRVWIF